jgi:hypothetical protein
MRAIALIVSHFLGDWIFQSRRVAVNKSKRLPEMIEHCLIVFFFAYVAFHVPLRSARCGSFECYLWPLLYTLTHAVIDLTIWRVFGKLMYDGKICRSYDNYWFWFTVGIDQMLHMVILFLLLGAE